jgi:hypothetical protein
MKFNEFYRLYIENYNDYKTEDQKKLDEEFKKLYKENIKNRISSKAEQKS